MTSLCVRHLNRRGTVSPVYILRPAIGRVIDESGDLVGIHSARAIRDEHLAQDVRFPDVMVEPQTLLIPLQYHGHSVMDETRRIVDSGSDDRARRDGFAL